MVLFPDKHKTVDRAVPGLNLNVKQQPPGVLDHILDAAQEEDSLSAIDQPVVVCQGKVHHRPCEDVTVHNNRALHNGMHPKNR
jgi:hypothetical protein